jgi:hypothetical protein
MGYRRAAVGRNYTALAHAYIDSTRWNGERGHQDQDPGSSSLHELMTNDAGLPMRSMRTIKWHVWTSSSEAHRASGLAVPPWFPHSGREARFPLRPIWPGFALDTAFYGILAFLLWSAPGAIRRHRRRARGRCPACGYDLKGAPTAMCPECGS